MSKFTINIGLGLAAFGGLVAAGLATADQKPAIELLHAPKAEAAQTIILKPAAAIVSPTPVSKDELLSVRAVDASGKCSVVLHVAGSKNDSGAGKPEPYMLGGNVESVDSCGTLTKFDANYATAYYHVVGDQWVIAEPGIRLDVLDKVVFK